MELHWLGKYRDIVGNFYRSANGYSQICKMELFGTQIRFSPYEVQIMEHIMEHVGEYKNMKWYAQQLGLSQATYSKYVQKLVHKGLVDKYHAANNRKNIILQVSPLGLQEYHTYAEHIFRNNFSELLAYWSTLTPEQLDAVRTSFEILSHFHSEFAPQEPPEEVPLVKLPQP